MAAIILMRLIIIIFRPLTGKTHQLRIVSKYLGCPIIGDNKYNKHNLLAFVFLLNMLSPKKTDPKVTP